MKTNIALHKTTKQQVDSIIFSKRAISIGISGPNGSGKSMIADYIACELLDVKSIDNHPYISILNGANQTGVGEIRELKNFFKLKVPADKPISRVAIIKNIDNISSAGQNALLKTLEEPPEGTAIIITAASRGAILPTISSRLQWVQARALSKKDLISLYSSDDFERNYLLSDGYLGRMDELHKSPNKSSLIAAMDQAKLIVSCSRFDKLVKIEHILKQEEYALDDLLLCLTKIYRSLLEKSIPRKKQQELVKKTDYVLQAQLYINKNTNPKLVLVQLFNRI